jgi:large subunit ribosomal protein L23
MNPYKIINHPYLTEKTMMHVERNNSLEFVVRMNATKTQIKKAVEQLFDVKVEKVTTRIDKIGKRALVKLSPDYEAEEIGMRIGLF